MTFLLHSPARNVYNTVVFVTGLKMYLHSKKNMLDSSQFTVTYSYHSYVLVRSLII